MAKWLAGRTAVMAKWLAEQTAVMAKWLAGQTAVMAKWLAGRTSVLPARGEPHMNAGFQCSANDCRFLFVITIDRMSSLSLSLIR